jgi:hypothetical protein
LLVAVVLIAAVVTTYSAIRYSSLQDQPQVLSAIDETNLALKQILGFTVGYYGSVLKVTGNSSYARTLATNYLRSGLDNIGDIRPEWGPSFNVTTLALSADWFTNTSYSMGQIAVKYDLTGLGVSGINYITSCRLDVQIMNSNFSSQARLGIFKDENESLINLGKQNFKFYRYIYANSTWELVNPNGNLTSYANGTYVIDLPSEVAGDSYVLQVEDSRGIVVTASSFSRYSSTLAWNGNYSTIPNENTVIELLQNGTMRWLGQNLNLTQATKPIPPIPVKAIHVNQTISDVNQEVPFQTEDWASEYRIPLGLTSNVTVFSNRQMIVFLANSNVSKVTIWWDGRDTANQTTYSKYNPSTSPFKNDNVDDVKNGFLSNGLLNLTVQITGDNRFQVISKIKTMTSTSEMMRIDNERSWDYSSPSYVIHHGIVRDIVQEEPEWRGGPGDTASTGTCPNVFAQVVITLPANATYFTYQLRLMFLDSQQNRQISDLCPIKLTTSPAISQLQTENGTLNGLPRVVDTISSFNAFYNFSDGRWAHHWSQFISGAKGAGIMFTDTANQMLYIFDTPVGKTGAIKADSANKIELLPVTNSTQLTTSALDVTWHGAVVTFDNTTPIYQNSTNSGLWITVEYPPTITVTAET